MRSFCVHTRAFFHASDVYFWSCSSDGELTGTEADGEHAESFRGTRLRPGDPSIAPSIAIEAVQKRRAFFLNHVNVARYPWLAKCRAHAAMAAPLLVSGEVVGAIAFVLAAPHAGFDDDAVAKVTILAAQLGTGLEALRLNQLSREEHRRATVLVEAAGALHGLPDTAAVMESIADRLCVLLHSPAVLVLIQQEKVQQEHTQPERRFQLQAVSTEAPKLAQSIRSRFEQNNLRSAMEIATRAVAAGERITVSIDGASHFGEDSPPGVLIAAPFRTSRLHGAILVYPRFAQPFTEEDKTLVSALVGFGAVAVANAELCGMARAKAHELHEILEISFELGSAGKLDEFMQTSAARAASFLGFKRCFIGLFEESAFRIRWGVENGKARPVDIPLYDGVASHTLKQKNVFVTENASVSADGDLDFVAAFHIRQLLAVPLLGSNGDVLGMFSVLDRIEPGPINEEDVRRARALAAQVAIALELTRNLHQSEEHRRRAEALVAIALELNTVLNLPEFARKFALRAAALLGGRSVALSLFETAELDTVLICGAGEGGLSETRVKEGGVSEANVSEVNVSEINDKALLRRFSRALSAALPKYSTDVAYAPASDMLGSALASGLGWTDCTLVRLAGSSGELVGVLCLADRGAAPSADDRLLLRAIAGHASIALENACLFTRMQQANRHWLEVFDAISDFIVVHDEQQNILRVNRSLADFVGIESDQLIGINMRALEALSTGTSPHTCPFCRSGEGLDEYVHPVLDRTYLISTSRIHAASSTQLQTVHVLKDITDRRDAERRYRELFDNIQEGIYVSTPQGRFVEVNDSLVRILGYSSRDEVLQLDIPTQVYFSEERRQELAEVLKRGGEMHNHEEVLRRKDGSPVHVFMNCFALRDSGGNVLQHRGLMLDVSGLHQSQTELQKERDFSSKILSHTQSLILVTDTEGVISYANRRWSGLGFQQSQILARPLPDLCAPPRRAALREALADVARGQQVDNFDLPLVRGDGVSAQFSVNLSPISGEDGRVSSIVVVMTDVTDSAMLRSKLMHAEKMAAVGKLVAGVAHEVNNPLTAILGFTDLLMENPELPESARRDLRVILQEAQRTKQIVQNLLSFARQVPPQRQAVQLNSILQRTVHLRSYDFISHGIDVVEHLDESLPPVVGDSHQLQQVFLNILNNAYDAVRESASPSHPARIEIRSAHSSAFVEISFSDNGVGIADPDRIFDPFFTTKDVGKGTGLGLSICYGIVHEHGGEIVCHNNQDSEGATFIVRLPVAAEAASFGAVAGVHPK
ncbi:MAG TPA: PAS domain S-box protein [Terriglobales bacterium]|nr:PAS domain S-box protein [Terriglobales bacterium]